MRPPEAPTHGPPAAAPVGAGLVATAAATALVAVVLAFASLLPLGKWHPDEFIQIHDIASTGWRAVTTRVFGWSPRPVSEFMLWLYARLVIATGRTWLQPVLAAYWLASILILLLAMRGRRAHPVLTALALFAAVLLLEKPGEMFFWPAAAAAYLLGFALLGAAVTLQADRNASPLLFGAVLVASAWCSEIGAVAVLVDVVLLGTVGLAVPGVLRRSVVLPIAAGAAASVFVLGISLGHRAAPGAARLVAQSTTIGAPVASLRAALPVALHELASTGPAGETWPPLPALALKAALLIGLRPSCTGAVPLSERVRPLVFAVALFVAAGASISLGFLEFGENCCERHETFRAALIVLALYGAAAAWPARRPTVVRHLVLILPLLALFAARVPALRADRGLIGLTRADRTALWRSGRAPGPTMVWRNPPMPQLAEGAWSLPAGSWTIGRSEHPPAADWRIGAILAFFGKQQLVVRDR